MTREVFEKALKEGIHSFYYIFKDFGIGRDCKHFVETGTYMGDAVNYAVGLGFEQIFSCELSEERYNHCLEKFKDNVHLIKGNSNILLKKIDMTKIDYVFLDGGHHYETVKNDLNQCIPVLENNGTILCDDYDLSYAPGVKKAIDEFVKINNFKCKILKRFAKIEKI